MCRFCYEGGGEEDMEKVWLVSLHLAMAFALCTHSRTHAGGHTGGHTCRGADIDV